MANKGKHAAKKNETDKSKDTENPSVIPSFQAANFSDPENYAPSNYVLNSDSEFYIKKKSRAPRAFAIFLGGLVAILLVVYLIGAGVFHFFFLPRTTLATEDISFKTSTDVATILEDHFANFDVAVKGSDLDFSVNASSAKISANTGTIATTALETSNPWCWPYEILRTRDVTSVVAENINEGSLATVISENVDAVNASKIAPENAYIKWDGTSSSFVVESEKQGTKIDSNLVKAKVLSAIVSMEKDVMVGTAEYILPTMVKSDSRFKTAIEQANVYAKAKFNILMGDYVAATVDGETIQRWINVGEDFTVIFDEAAASEWANGIAEGCNTVGSQRTYTRPDGKVITVSGGTYGWQADGSGLAESVISTIKSGGQQDITVSATQTAAVLAKKGEQDWGKRYVDIDLAEQHAYMYDENGALIWESDIVSGDPTEGDATPTGVYVCNSKESPSRLRGPMVNGKAQWDSEVSYWMPFVGNLVGLHDATWQSAFGGSRYTSGYGSRGCVNLPLAKAQAIYSLIVVGDVVITHN